MHAALQLWQSLFNVSISVADGHRIAKGSQRQIFAPSRRYELKRCGSPIGKRVSIVRLVVIAVSILASSPAFSQNHNAFSTPILTDTIVENSSALGTLPTQVANFRNPNDTVRGYFTYALDERGSTKFTIDNTGANLSLKENTTFDYESTPTFVFRITSKKKESAPSTAVPNTLTVTLTITDVDERPEVLKPYQIVEGGPGRNVYVTRQPDTPIQSIIVNQVFKDPEGKFIQLKPCADDFQIVETLLENAEGVNRGSFTEDANADGSGSRHCAPQPTGSQPNNKDVTRGGKVVNVNTSGPVITITPIAAGSSGVRKAVITFRGWAGTPVTQNINVADIIVSNEAKITVYVKTGINNVPDWGVVGFRTSVAETLNDAPVLVGPESFATNKTVWNATDLDGNTDTITYSLRGTRETGKCAMVNNKLQEGAIKLGSGCVWLDTSDPEETSQPRNVQIKGRNLDYETAPINKQYTVILVASDGYSAVSGTSKSVPITITIKNVNEQIKTPTQQNAIREIAELVSGRAGRSVDLNKYFSDPDGTAITYGIVNQNEAYVSHSLSGSVLTVNPVGPVGTALLTITATSTDGSSGLATQLVTVRQTNRPPNFVGGISSVRAERSIPENQSSGFIVRVPALKYTDPDNDTVKATVIDSALFEAEVDPTISGTKRSGEIGLKLVGSLDYELSRQHNVQVQLNDGWDNSTSTVTVQVDVGDINEPPTIVPNSQIPPQSVSVDATTSINLLEYFRDPEGRVLILNATVTGGSSNVEATVIGSGTVQLKGLAATGNTPAIVSVTASDGVSTTPALTFNVTVSANNPPTLATPIQDRSMRLSEGEVVIDLTGTFVDNDANDSVARYEASSNNNAFVLTTLSQNGRQLTLIPRAEGSTSITVTAIDTRGGRATTSFNVTVIGNTPPTVVRPIPTENLRPNQSATVDLSTFFNDPDNDQLTYTVTVDNPNTATATISNNRYVIITARSRGSANITVRAADPDGEFVETRFLVSVINEAPIAVDGLTADVTVRGATDTVNVGPFFSDPNGDALTFTVSVSNETVATAVLVGSRLTVSGLSIGSADITVTASDPFDAQASTTFTVSIVNQEPVASSPLSNRMAVRQETLEIDLSQHFSDPDGDALTFTAAVADPAIATSSIMDNMLMLTGAGLGMTTVTVTAQDAFEGFVSATFNITIENLDPMVINTIADQTNVRGVALSVDLTQVFSDPDGDPLTFTAAVANSNVATATIEDGNMLVFEGIGVGETVIRVEARDETGRPASTSFNILIENQAPIVIREIDPQETHRLGVVSIALDTVFSDPDEDLLTYRAEADDDSVVLVRIVRGQLNVTGRSVNSTSVTVTARDEYGGSVSTSFDVTVQNRAPTVANAPPNLTVNRTEMPSIDVSSVFADEDNDALTLAVASSDERVAAASLSGQSLTIQPFTLGMTVITLTATDPYDAVATTTFDVMVENIAPRVARPLPNITTNRLESVAVNLTGVFIDDDGDDMTLSVSAADETLVSASISEETLSLMGLLLGSTIVTVTATDVPGATAMTTFNLTVENLAPTVGDTIANFELQVGGEPVTQDVATAFADDGPEALALVVTSSNELIATATISGTMVTATPVSKGTTSVVVTATDAQGLSVSQTVPVTVSEDQLKAVANNTLASFSRAVLNSLSTTVGARLMADADGLYSPFMTYSLEDFAPSQDYVVPVDSFLTSSPFATPQDGWSPVLSQAYGPGDYSLTNNGIEQLLGRGFALNLGAVGDPTFWSVWGGIDRQAFEASNHDGNVNSFYFGGDMTIRGQWTLGLAVGRSSGKADYTYGTATQTMENDLTSILPYARMAPSDRTTVYGAIGFGSGSVDTTVIGQDNAVADLKGTLGVFGGRQVVYTMMNGLNLAVVGDYGFANLETDDGESSAHGLVGKVSKFRGGLETSFNMAMGADGSFVPFLTLGFRSDSGDGEPDSGLEVTGGLRITNPVFSLDANFRTLATYGVDDYSESGFSLMAVLNPTAGATGLSLSLSPSWGASTMRTNSLWHDDFQSQRPADLASWGIVDNESMKFDSSLGYGFLVSHDRFLLTPFVDVQSGYSNLNDVSVGLKLIEQLSTRSNLKVNLKVGQDSQMSGTQEESVLLDARLNF